MKTAKTKKQKTVEQDRNQTCKKFGDYVICDGRWLTVCDTGEDGLSMLMGNVSVDKQLDMTWLSSWKSRSPAPKHFKSIQDFEAESAKLPEWNETRWACKSYDFSDGELIDCRTGNADSKSKEAKAQIKRIRASQIAMN